jgi:hypothetical protein
MHELKLYIRDVIYETRIACNSLYLCNLSILVAKKVSLSININDNFCFVHKIIHTHSNYMRSMKREKQRNFELLVKLRKRSLKRPN